MTAYTANDAKRMNATARGPNFARFALVPGHVANALGDMAKTGLTGWMIKVLDYGAGKGKHGVALSRAYNVSVTCYDVGDNAKLRGNVGTYTDGLYDIVYASNVLNVQATHVQIVDVLQDLNNAARPNGLVFFNYPEQPRHSNAELSYVADMAEAVFASVDYLGHGVFSTIATTPTMPCDDNDDKLCAWQASEWLRAGSNDD